MSKLMFKGTYCGAGEKLVVVGIVRCCVLVVEKDWWL